MAVSPGEQVAAVEVRGSGGHGAHDLRFAFCHGPETLEDGVRQLGPLAQ